MTRGARTVVAGTTTLILGAALWQLCGLYSVPPIGALPEGRTLVVWRGHGEPFFNSPDGVCLKRTGGVSLMCRGAALSQAPLDRIILRLPYLKFAYNASVGGRAID